MPWNEKIQKEGWGEVELWDLKEAQAYATEHDIPIVREEEWDRQANSFPEQLRGTGKIKVVSLDGTQTYEFSAIPVDIRPLGPETPGKCFDDEQRGALVRVAEVGAAESDRQRVQFDVGRGAVKSDEIKAIRKDCEDALEVWRSAIEGFAENIGAKTNTSKTAGVRNARAGLTKNGAHGMHFDGAYSSIRVVSVVGGGFLECCITAVSKSGEPMILGAHGASNPIDEVGCLCAGRLPLAEKEDYCFTKKGSGFSKLFFMERKLPDGSVKYVLYGPVWKSKFHGAFVLHCRVVLHAIDVMLARWRGDAGSSPLNRARTAESSPRNDLVKTAASSPRNDLVKNCRVHPTH